MKKHPTQKCLLILLFSICLSLPAAPVLRIGIFSDTHVTEDKNSCILLEKALTLFTNKRAEMVINAGDIAQVTMKKPTATTGKQSIKSTGAKKLRKFLFMPTMTG